MADKYEITSKSGDIGSLGFTTTSQIKDTETGKTGEVCHYTGSPQQERDAVGKAIQEGKVRWDN